MSVKSSQKGLYMHCKPSRCLRVIVGFSLVIVTLARVFPGIFAPGKAHLARPANNPRIGTTNVHTWLSNGVFRFDYCCHV